jgi:hypothetical protein
MVEGGPFVITRRNCGALSDLSDEFEFAELAAACEDFSRSRLPVAGFESPSIVERLLLRLNSMEERQRARAIGRA